MDTHRIDRVAATLTIDEVATMHRVSRRTVQRWIAKGALAVSKLPGGTVRINENDAQNLLAPSRSEEQVAS